MDAHLTFKLCWCGRHGYFANSKTGERLAGDVFSQSSAVEIVQIIVAEDKSLHLNLDQFRASLRETVLPPEELPGMPELLELDNKLDVSTEILPTTEEEMTESIHEFLDMFFPGYQATQRVLQ